MRYSDAGRRRSGRHGMDLFMPRVGFSASGKENRLEVAHSRIHAQTCACVETVVGKLN